jgi:hypothetical protein
VHRDVRASWRWRTLSPCVAGVHDDSGLGIYDTNVQWIAPKRSGLIIPVSKSLSPRAVATNGE